MLALPFSLFIKGLFANGIKGLGGVKVTNFPPSVTNLPLDELLPAC
jgi:hypothetical protein